MIENAFLYFKRQKRNKSKRQNPLSDEVILFLKLISSFKWRILHRIIVVKYFKSSSIFLEHNKADVERSA